MNSKKKLILIISVILFVVLFIFFFYFFSFEDKISIKLYINSDINKNIYNIDHMDNDLYSLQYQELIEKDINTMEDKNKYTFNNPLLILNPYGTNLTGLYIYFETANDRALEYTISVDDETIPDYNNMLVGDLTKIHRGQIIGLVQGMKNTITFRMLDEDLEQVAVRKVVINMPLLNEESMLKIKIKDNKTLNGGLIYVPYDKENSYLSFYDDNGILRMELYGNIGDTEVFKYNSAGDLLYLSDSKYIHINNYGKIINYYDDISNISNFVDNDKIKNNCVIKNNTITCFKYGFSNIFFGILKGYLNDDTKEEINKIIVSKDKKYKYNPSTNTLFGFNGLMVGDFTYYDSIYFDVYEYNKDEIVIPSKVDMIEIKKITGFNLSDVKIIKIESGIEEIMDYCFVGVRKLEKIYIPKSVKKIGKDIFGDREVEIIYY